MHKFKHICLILISLMLSGCSDYQTGYQEGMQGMEKQTWLILGKAEYTRGYHAGAAEKFQQDWLAENPIELAGLVCRPPGMQQEEFKFSPAGYDHITDDVFKLID